MSEVDFSRKFVCFGMSTLYFCIDERWMGIESMSLMYHDMISTDNSKYFQMICLSLSLSILLCLRCTGRCISLNYQVDSGKDVCNRKTKSRLHISWGTLNERNRKKEKEKTPSQCWHADQSFASLFFFLILNKYFIHAGDCLREVFGDPMP
jgi:hypothetical protein